MLMRAAPVLFVLLWSTGFIGSKLGAADAEPFTFLSLRFFLVLVILVPVVLYSRRAAGSWGECCHAMLAGTLIHGVYLGGVFWAIRQGMPAGVAAFIVSLQPIVTSLLSSAFLGERLSGRHWLGLAIGLIGALLTLAPKLEGAFAGTGGINGATIAATGLALLSISAGTIYQKRFAARIDLVAGALWQYLGALAVVAAGALLFETRSVAWTPKFIFALSWLTIVLSIGAIFLLMLLIRQNSVAHVSGLFYLVPAATAVIAYAVFGERLDWLQLAGLALAALGVLLISAGPQRFRPIRSSFRN